MMTNELIPDSIMKIYDSAGTIYTTESEVKEVLVDLLIEAGEAELNFTSDVARDYVAERLMLRLKSKQK